MIIIKLTYTTSIEQIDKYLQQHREFLDNLYRQKYLLASGPMNPRTGGIIIAMSDNVAHAKEIFKNDPFYLAELADYEFIEFTPVKHSEVLKELILEKEGKLC